MPAPEALIVHSRGSSQFARYPALNEISVSLQQSTLTKRDDFLWQFVMLKATWFDLITFTWMQGWK